ncbi:hypothetical protein WG66_003634 [Moniliophthora roreri]|nr:hypothetical protein WG66_003634 [Moniliophthora roreri]
MAFSTACTAKKSRLGNEMCGNEGYPDGMAEPLADWDAYYLPQYTWKRQDWFRTGADAKQNYRRGKAACEKHLVDEGVREKHIRQFFCPQSDKTQRQMTTGASSYLQNRFSEIH